MDKKQQIILDIPTTNIELVEKFPKDPNADIKIIYKSQIFLLQKNILKQHSKYFQKQLSQQNAGVQDPLKSEKKIDNKAKTCEGSISTQASRTNSNNTSKNIGLQTLELKGSFDAKILYNVLSLIYGNTIEIQRLQVSSYIQVCLFLKIQQLVDMILSQIYDNLQQYDIFVLLKLANEYKLQQLQKICMQQLQNQQFEQLKYYQLSLVNMDLVLFKKIIKLHNAYKKQKKRGVNLKIIIDILKLYGQVNNFTDYSLYEMYLQLIQVSILNYTQYDQIIYSPVIKKIQFINQVIHRGQNSHKKNLSFEEQTQNRLKKQGKCFISILAKIQKNPLCASEQLYSIQEIRNFFQNIHYQKKIKQLQKNIAKLTQENKKLKEAKVKPQEKQKQLKLPTTPKKSLVKSSQINQNVDQTEKEKEIVKISNIIQVIDKMNMEFDEKIQQISQIVNNYEEKKKQQVKIRPRGSSLVSCSKSNSSKIKDHEKVQKSFSNQAVVDVDSFNKPLSKFKRLNSLNTQLVHHEISYPKTVNYANRVCFNQAPQSIASQNLSNLTQLVTQYGFTKKNFVLIYRRSRNKQFFGQPSSIYNRGALLVLLKAKQGQQVGGYISSRLNKDKDKDDKQIYDENAYIFNLQKKKKCKIIQSQASKAIILSKQFFISFSTDLQISTQCLKNKSKSKWSCDYKSNLHNNKKNVDSNRHIQNQSNMSTIVNVNKSFNMSSNIFSSVNPSQNLSDGFSRKTQNSQSMSNQNKKKFRTFEQIPSQNENNSSEKSDFKTHNIADNQTISRKDHKKINQLELDEQFEIQVLQIYEINQDQMEMLI